MAGGVGCAHQNIHNAGIARCTGPADDHAGVHVIIVQPAQLHGLLRVDQNDDAFQNIGGLLFFQVCHQVFFVFREVQVVPAFLGDHDRVVALAACPGQNHDGRVVAGVLPGCFLCAYILDLALGDLGTVGGAKAAVGGFAENGVDVFLAQLSLQSGDQRGRDDGVKGGSCGSAHGMEGAVSKYRDACTLMQGQRAVFIFQKDGAFLRLGDVFSGNIKLQQKRRLVVAAVDIIRIVVYDCAGGILCVVLNDFAGGQIQRRVDHARVTECQCGRRRANKQQKCHYSGDTAKNCCSFFHNYLHILTFVPVLQNVLPAYAAGKQVCRAADTSFLSPFLTLLSKSLSFESWETHKPVEVSCRSGL